MNLVYFFITDGQSQEQIDQIDEALYEVAIETNQGLRREAVMAMGGEIG